MKNAVKMITVINILINPHMKDISSTFDFVFKQKPINNGKMGSMHGDRTDRIPVKNENIGSISI